MTRLHSFRDDTVGIQGYQEVGVHMWSRIKYSNVGTMSEMNLLFLGFLATFHITHATAFIPDPFPAPVKRSQETNTSSPLQIDLGYKDITTPQTY